MHGTCLRRRKGAGSHPRPTSVYHAPHIEIKKRPSGAFSPFPRRGAPKLQSSAERTPQRPSGSSHASGRGGWVPKPYGGVTTPIAFFFGAPPHFFGQDQRNGVDSQHQPKVQQDKSASSSNPPPGRSFHLSRPWRCDLQQKNARRVARVWKGWTL